MSVSQRLDPNLCSAWMLQELSANPVLVALVGTKIYQQDAIPTEAEWTSKNRGDYYPFIYWTGGKTDHVPYYDVGQETIGKVTSRYIVRVQKRFNSPPPGNWDSEFYHQFRQTLTGIAPRDVLVNSQRIGVVWASRWKDDWEFKTQDQEARILESGIQIEISHL